MASPYGTPEEESTANRLKDKIFTLIKSITTKPGYWVEDIKDTHVMYYKDADYNFYRKSLFIMDFIEKWKIKYPVPSPFESTEEFKELQKMSTECIELLPKESEKKHMEYLEKKHMMELINKLPSVPADGASAVQKYLKYKQKYLELKKEVDN